jgi:putative endonuclease
MATVYILYSYKLDKFYIGSCLNLELRLEQHRIKEFSDGFTRKADDWKLFFSIHRLEYKPGKLSYILKK